MIDPFFGKLLIEIDCIFLLPGVGEVCTGKRKTFTWLRVPSTFAIMIFTSIQVCLYYLFIFAKHILGLLQ